MTIDQVAVVEDESARLVAAFEANPDGRVPWSERWTVATVARHVAGTHHVLAQVIAGRPANGFELFASLEVPDKRDPGFADWCRQGTAALVDQFHTVDPHDECWSWYDEGRHVGWWQRRMAQETLVHRWDAEDGAGVTSTPMDPAVAADGIDEYLEVFVGAGRSAASSPAGPSIEFETTDAVDRWLLQLPAEGRRIVSREGDDPALTLRGPAEGVLLVAWGRLTPDAADVEVLGDTSILDRWSDLIPPM